MSSRVAAGVGKKRQRHSRGTGSNAAGSEVGAPGGSDAAADEEPTTPAAAANTAAAPAELPPAIDIDAAAVTAQAGASQSASPSGHRAAKQRKLAHDDAGGESVAGSPAKQESPTPAPATPAGASAPTAVVVGTPVSEAGGVVSASPQSSAGASPVGSPNASGSPVTPTTPAATNAATDAAATTNTTSTTTTASAAASAAAPSASPALPSLPAGMNRGYYAQFYWASHYAPYESVPLSTPLPTFTEVVASIPAIFHQIVSVLQTVEYATRKRDVLVELDKKIVKTMSSKEVDLVPTLDRKLLLRSQACNQDYMIHACRKEHVRLIFASADDGGVLGKLALCPLLIDLFLVQQGGKRSLAGGSGGYRYAASAAGAGSAGAGGKRASGGAAASPTATNVPEKGFDYKCACGHTEKDDLPTAVSSSDPTSVKLESDAASPTAGRTIKSEVGESKVEDFDMADASPEAPHAQASPRATAPSLSPVPSSQRRVPGSGSDKSSLLRSPPSSGSGHPHGTSSSAGAAAAAADHSSHGGAGCINCASWSKKHAKQAKIIEKMKLELQAVHDERGLWEQKSEETSRTQRPRQQVHTDVEQIDSTCSHLPPPVSVSVSACICVPGAGGATSATTTFVCGRRRC